MAVVIKNVEEEIESLKTICEAFLVAIEIAGLPSVSINMGQALDRRKSRIVQDRTTSSSNIYLELVNIPQITRNVSETQLSAIKTAGSKAISNVTQQFSKLNKIALKSKLRGKPHFTIGQPKKQETSSESEDECENSIFQPRACGDKTSTRYASDSSGLSVEQGLECTETAVVCKEDVFLPSVGIVMGQTNNQGDANDGEQYQATLEQKQNLLSRVDSSQLDEMQLSSIMQNVTMGAMPEIQVNSEHVTATSEQKIEPPKTLKLDHKYSHSSSEIDDPRTIIEHKNIDRSSSDYELQKNMSQSQSDSGLRQTMASIASPVSTAKDLFSPLSKLAKGMQTFGANFDPRKLGGQVRYVSQKDMEEHRKLQEKWSNSKCRLIAL